MFFAQAQWRMLALCLKLKIYPERQTLLVFFSSPKGIACVASISVGTISKFIHLSNFWVTLHLKSYFGVKLCLVKISKDAFNQL